MTTTPRRDGETRASLTDISADRFAMHDEILQLRAEVDDLYAQRTRLVADRDSIVASFNAAHARVASLTEDLAAARQQVDHWKGLAEAHKANTQRTFDAYNRVLAENSELHATVSELSKSAAASRRVVEAARPLIAAMRDPKGYTQGMIAALAAAVDSLPAQHSDGDND